MQISQKQKLTENFVCNQNYYFALLLLLLPPRHHFVSEKTQIGTKRKMKTKRTRYENKIEKK